MKKINNKRVVNRLWKIPRQPHWNDSKNNNRKFISYHNFPTIKLSISISIGKCCQRLIFRITSHISSVSSPSECLYLYDVYIYGLIMRLKNIYIIKIRVCQYCLKISKNKIFIIQISDIRWKINETLNNFVVYILC